MNSCPLWRNHCLSQFPGMGMAPLDSYSSAKKHLGWVKRREMPQRRAARKRLLTIVLSWNLFPTQPFVAKEGLILEGLQKILRTCFSP